MFNFLKNISPTELIILAAILLLLFGSKIFVSLGKTSGETLKEIKKIKKNFTEAVEDEEPKKEG
jgi:Sec-independent protein translocase protein TatA